VLTGVSASVGVARSGTAPFGAKQGGVRHAGGRGVAEGARVVEQSGSSWDPWRRENRLTILGSGIQKSRAAPQESATPLRQAPRYSRFILSQDLRFATARCSFGAVLARHD
jgi:hypothetical protein